MLALARSGSAGRSPTYVRFVGVPLGISVPFVAIGIDLTPHVDGNGLRCAGCGGRCGRLHGRGHIPARGCSAATAVQYRWRPAMTIVVDHTGRPLAALAMTIKYGSATSKGKTRAGHGQCPAQRVWSPDPLAIGWGVQVVGLAQAGTGSRLTRHGFFLISVHHRYQPHRVPDDSRRSRRGRHADRTRQRAPATRPRCRRGPHRHAACRPRLRNHQRLEDTIGDREGRQEIATAVANAEGIMPFAVPPAEVTHRNELDQGCPPHQGIASDERPVHPSLCRYHHRMSGRSSPCSPGARGRRPAHEAPRRWVRGRPRPIAPRLRRRGWRVPRPASRPGR